MLKYLTQFLKRVKKMKTIDYNKLRLEYFTRSGSFGKVCECTYNGKKYAFKEFEDDKFLSGKIMKLTKISKFANKHIIVPKLWVCKDDKKIGYLTDYVNGHDIYYISPDSKKEKYKTLRFAKEVLETIHNKNIIHSDISSSNIMIENGVPKFIDFDNSSYKLNGTDLRFTNDLARDFIEHYGICKELDVFLFNILTYQLMNDVLRNMVRGLIRAGNYRTFEEAESIEICKSLLLQKSYPNEKYLIDTVDETKFNY